MAAVFEAEPSVLAEKRKLRKSLFRFDLIFFTVCAILAIDTIGQSSSYGAQAIFWLVVSAATFLIPYGLLTSELGTTFPVEGGPYEWVRLAFGHMAGAITAVLYWLSNPIWLGGTLAATAIAALDALWGTKIGGNTGLSIVVGLGFIWVAVMMNILSLRSMKWVPNLGALVKLGLFALFAVLVVVTGTQHGFKGSLGGMFDGLGPAFIGVIGVLVFQWVGFELTTNASEEMENPQRDVPRAVAFSGIISTLGYAVPIIGVILVLSSKDITNVSGFVAGYQTVVSDALGTSAANVLNGVVGAAVVFALLSSGVVWLMGSDRLMAIGALAGSGPRGMGYFSKRFGTPVPVNVLSGILASLFLIANFLITGGSLKNFFTIVLGLVISTTTFSYVLVFPALVVLRRKYPNARRPYRVGGGVIGLWVTMLLCEAYVVGATIFSLWPNLFSSDVTNAVSVGGVSIDRGTYELTVFGATAIMLVIAVIFWAVGRRHAIYDRWPDEGTTADRRVVAGVTRA
ncbi:MAG TPA: APC family permease [Candidatus Dormibacteraeota bacterium]